MDSVSAYSWPAEDCTRVPYGIYLDPNVFAREQKQIFRGPVWNYLALEAEIPRPGDFRLIDVGDIPVIVDRAADGTVHAFVNRCAHRGAIVRRELTGNATSHTCCYHQWSYDLKGNLVSASFRRGVKGKGGLPSDFDLSCHGLERLRVETHKGVLFGTFSNETEPLLEYLDAPFVAHLDRMFRKPIRILGYQRQRVFGNWKLYTDNLRDPNHGGLLHMFQITFGLARNNQPGGARLDRRHRHNLSWAAQGKKILDNENAYADTQRGDMDINLRDPSFLQYRKEFDDEYTLTIASVFPNAVFQQIGNTLATRQIRTRSPGEFEIFWTFFGYADDDEEMVRHRLRKANLVGPAGLVSMEDGEAIELIQRAIVEDAAAHSFVEYGGRGPIPGDQETLVTEVPMRGFWLYYCELMGIRPGSQA
jgi:anthranilate 1,2-dioxygenase large subunit